MNEIIHSNQYTRLFNRMNNGEEFTKTSAIAAIEDEKLRLNISVEEARELEQIANTKGVDFLSTEATEQIKDNSQRLADVEEMLTELYMGV